MIGEHGILPFPASGNSDMENAVSRTQKEASVDESEATAVTLVGSKSSKNCMFYDTQPLQPWTVTSVPLFTQILVLSHVPLKTPPKQATSGSTSNPRHVQNVFIWMRLPKEVGCHPWKAIPHKFLGCQESRATQARAKLTQSIPTAACKGDSLRWLLNFWHLAVSGSWDPLATTQLAELCRI